MKIMKCLFITCLLSLSLASLSQASEKSAPFFITAESMSFCQFPESRADAEMSAKNNADFLAYAECIGENRAYLRVSEYLVLTAQCHVVARAEYICE